MEQEETLSMKKVKQEESPSMKKTEHGEMVLKICKIIAGICIIIAVIAMWNMFSDFLEFASYLGELRQMVPDYVWNDPQVQSAISQGYGELARIPLTLAIPMFVVAIAVYGVGKKAANKRVEE